MLKRLLIVLLSAWLLSACQTQEQNDAAFDLNNALGGADTAGFARATETRPFQFPADHSAHPEFRNEWWYITGNLQTATGRAFGYQVTLFRIALTPTPPQSASVWATNQVWMGHVALTDVQTGEHVFAERFARGAAGLAGQSVQPFRVWLEDWQIQGQAQGEFPWQVQVKTADFSLDLSLDPSQPPVLQGEQGLSQKSSAPGNASYYYSLPRLRTQGTVQHQGESFVVTGESWLDREWSTSVLGDDQAGWDWFSLQLHAGPSVMFYRLRHHDGSADTSHSQGKWITAAGQASTLSLEDVELKPLRYWASPKGVSYPVAWSMQLPERQQNWRVEAVLDEQLMQTSVPYWEGAVRVLDADSGEVLGVGYLEMSGYER